MCGQVLTAIAALGVVACGASTTPDATPSGRALGMNDITMLLPLPPDLASPVVMTMAGGDAPLALRGLVASLLVDIGPKNGMPYAYEDFHVVALRIDLCERPAPGACPDGADGRLRLVLQPLYRQDGATLAHDIALHAFYPIPVAELPGVIVELRELAELAEAAGVAPTAPLAVSPALTAPTPPPGYAARLTALVATYARWDRLVKLTVAGQDKLSAAFAWIFRGFEQVGGEMTPIAIPTLGPTVTHQHLQLAGGDVVYQITPVADSPRGFTLAANGLLFATATAAARTQAVEALAEIENPTLRDPATAQCVTCHVATVLTPLRAAAAGIDPSTVADRYHSPYDLSVDTIAGTDARVVRALGWATSFPAISQRVANDTAQVLAEIEMRYPAR